VTPTDLRHADRVADEHQVDRGDRVRAVDDRERDRGHARLAEPLARVDGVAAPPRLGEQRRDAARVARERPGRVVACAQPRERRLALGLGAVREPRAPERRDQHRDPDADRRTVLRQQAVPVGRLAHHHRVAVRRRQVARPGERTQVRAHRRRGDPVDPVGADVALGEPAHLEGQRVGAARVAVLDQPLGVQRLQQSLDRGAVQAGGARDLDGASQPAGQAVQRAQHREPAGQAADLLVHAGVVRRGFAHGLAVSVHWVHAVYAPGVRSQNPQPRPRAHRSPPR
jgi:hypothetical protein